MTLAGCPWETLRPAILQFCEAPLCSWIKQPANSVSSFAYVAVGSWIWFREKSVARAALRSLGIVAILVGLTSALYHASMVFFTEVMDLGSMFLLSSGCIVLNLIRLKKIQLERWWVSFSWLIAISLFLTIFTRVRGIDIFAFQIVVTTLLEVWLFFRHRFKIQYNQWLLSVGLFLLSYGVWLLDYHRIVCDPDRHWLQGHAVWHVMNSFVFLSLFRFYHQFPEFQRTKAELQADRLAGL